MDTNLVIDYLSNQLPTVSALEIDKLPGIISVITRIELLGWLGATTGQLEKLQPFLNNAQVYTLSEDVIEQTIIIRQKHKIKLPDAIIAATTIVYNHTLLTRNTEDFKGIGELSVENPWQW